MHGYEVPAYAVSNDFYRQALTLDLRGKREYTDVILSAMGGMGKMQFSQYKALLKLSDESLELADRHAIEEKRLRYITAVAPELHAEIVRQIIDFNLTSKQIKEVCEGDFTDDTSDDPLEKLSAVAVKLARMTQSLNTTSPEDFARALIRQEGDPSIARARIEATQRLLEAAS